MHYVYKIVNKVNNKTYVGQRKLTGTSKDTTYMGSGRLIKLAIKKYGRENFVKTILQDNIVDQDMANKWERYWIAYERLCGHAEYNIADGGIDEHCLFKGHKHTEVSIYKIKDSLKKTLEEKYGDVHFNKGRHVSEETKTKISKSLRGRKQTNDWKYKRTRCAVGNTYVKSTKWYNNGTKNIRLKEGELPPEGFVLGRLYFSRQRRKH